MYLKSSIAAITLFVCSWQPSQAAEPVQLGDLIADALTGNREVLAAQKRYEAARQRPVQAGSLPEPVLSASYASTGGPLPGQGLGSQVTSNIGVMLSQELPYPGKRQLRSAIAMKDAGAEWQQYLAVELNIRSRVTQAYHRLHHSHVAIGVLERSKDLMTQMLRASEARYAQGKTSQQDIFKTQTQLSILEIRIIGMQQDQETAEAELNSLLNRKPGTHIGDLAESEDLPPLMSLEELLAKAGDLAPELKREQKLIERSELQVNLARKDFHPDYTVAAGYFNMGTMPPMFQVRVDIPLQIFSEKRQHPALTEQVDRLAEARRNYEAADQSLQFRIRESYIAAETALRLSHLYENTILPQGELTVESSLTAYANGTADLASVLANVIARIDTEEQMHETRLNYQLALAKLEEMTAVTFFNDGSSGRGESK